MKRMCKDVQGLGFRSHLLVASRGYLKISYRNG